MDNDLQIILEFLARCGTEVQGRASSEQPLKRDLELLHRFATGKCNEEERVRACGILAVHPAWLRWISDRVKAVRAESLKAPARDRAPHSES